MPLTKHRAIARARSFIETINESTIPDLAKRNKKMADEFIVSIFDCGLIERNQFEELTAEAQKAWSDWTPNSRLD